MAQGTVEKMVALGFLPQALNPVSVLKRLNGLRARDTSRHLTFASLLTVTDGINRILVTSLGLHLLLAD